MKRLLLIALLVAACSAPKVASGPKPSADYGVLPDSLFLPAGVVRVLLVDSIGTPEPNRMILGRFNALTRTVYISKQIESPQQRLKTLHHEVCHIVLIDSGIQNILYTVLDPQMIETLCDALATARMAELSRQ